MTAYRLYPVEYDIIMSTGEKLLVSEIDVDRISDAAMRSYIMSEPPALSRFTRASREVMEQAKVGYDAPFMRALGSPPVAMLIRAGGAKCAEWKSCLSRDSRLCTAAGGKRVGSRRVELVPCWTHGGGSDEENEVMTVSVKAWHDGRTVVIVIG